MPKPANPSLKPADIRNFRRNAKFRTQSRNELLSRTIAHEYSCHARSVLARGSLDFRSIRSNIRAHSSDRREKPAAFITFPVYPPRRGENRKTADKRQDERRMKLRSVIASHMDVRQIPFQLSPIPLELLYIRETYVSLSLILCKSVFYWFFLSAVKCLRDYFLWLSRKKGNKNRDLEELKVVGVR